MTRRPTAKSGDPLYFLLADPRPAGPILGRYGNHPIAAAVTDCFGRVYAFAGIAPRRRDGGYDTASLRRGEWLVPPGLIYRDTQSAN